MSSSFSWLWKVLVWVFATKAVFDFWKAMLKTWTEIDQLNKKADVVLWEFRWTVEKVAKQSAKSMWLTNNEFVKATTNMADLLVPMGFVREEAVTMSTDMVKLSWALSEWTWWKYNAAEASEILAKAMLWETEQLKAMGIKIDQSTKQFGDRVKAMMIEKWITLEQAKALDIQRQIFEKSTDAQKAYEEWAWSLVRQQNELNATLKWVKEEMWTALIPVINELMQTLTPVIESIAKWSKEVMWNKNNQEKLKEWIIAIIDVLKIMFQTIWRLITKWYEFWEILWQLLSDAYNKFLEFKDNIIIVWEWIKSWISNIIDSIMSKINWLLDKATAALNKIKWIFKSITSIGKKIGWWVSSAAWAIKGWAVKVWWAIASVFREKWWPVEHNKPYIVWEKWPELFIPHRSWNITSNKNLWWWANINVNMWGVVVNNSADENRLVDKMKSMLINEARLFNIWIHCK